MLNLPRPFSPCQAEEAARLQAENELCAPSSSHLLSQPSLTRRTTVLTLTTFPPPHTSLSLSLQHSFEQQAAELQPILDMQEAAVLREMATELIREDWGRLLLCRPTPDPRILKDVNGFVNVHSASSPDTFDDALATFRMYESVASEAAELGNRALDEDMRRSAVLTRIKELHRGGSLDAEQTAALEAFVHEGDLWHALQGLKDSGGLDAPSAQLLSEGCSTQSLAAVGSRMRSLCRALLDAATAVFLAEGQNSAYGESQLMKLGLWRSQKDARLQRAELGHGFVLEVPRPVAMSALAIRLVHQAREEPVNPADAFIAVGGVVSIEVLALPPAPKTIRNWIVQVTPGPLQPLQYSVSAGNMSVTYGLPDGLLRPEGDPIFGWLDPQEKRWVPLEAPGKLDGRQATFFASKTGQFALLYPRTRCLPYRAWRLEANVPEGGATLTLYPIGMGAFLSFISSTMMHSFPWSRPLAIHQPAPAPLSSRRARRTQTRARTERPPRPVSACLPQSGRRPRSRSSSRAAWPRSRARTSPAAASPGCARRRSCATSAWPGCTSSRTTPTPTRRGRA